MANLDPAKMSGDKTDIIFFNFCCKQLGTRNFIVWFWFPKDHLNMGPTVRSALLYSVCCPLNENLIFQNLLWPCLVKQKIATSQRKVAQRQQKLLRTLANQARIRRVPIKVQHQRTRVLETVLLFQETWQLSRQLHHQI